MESNINNKVTPKQLMQTYTKHDAVSNPVNSPYAKYNSRGELMCIVCGIPVKSKIIWHAHTLKKSHKENLARLKEKQEKISQLQYKQHKQTQENRKRPLPSSCPILKETKVIKLEKPKGILKNINRYSSSDDDSDEEQRSDINCIERIEVKQEPSLNSKLPNSFFDESQPSLYTTQPHNIKLEQKKDEKTKPSTSEALPEGFFDDPVEDAKARKVEYRDKNAEEWESFMKEVSVAEVESRQIIADDKEEAAFETQLEQTNEQIMCLERIVELDKAKQSQLSEKKMSTKEPEDNESSDEEFSPFIWRTKNSLI